MNSDKPEADEARAHLARFARAIGLEVLDDARASECDAVIVLGGDGTMLSAVHRFPGIPLLGLNLGSLGYLAGVEAPHFEDALRALRDDAFSISRRTALSVLGRAALNDVVFSRGTSGHAAVIALSVDGRTATRFFADGLVVATPTGSTAYSLAAGGPILLPDSRSVVVTPVCPHALSSRPVVVRDDSRLAVRLVARPGAETLDIFADGEAVAQVQEGKEVVVEKASVTVPLVELPGADPFEVLSRKLGWAGSSIR
ncbi:MAG: NAD(+)/NADH kinase [Kiritimatiellae bacterium]|nr:NAD(+)/NADH kinase [Kiritimatiellia bacterium]